MNVSIYFKAVFMQIQKALEKIGFSEREARVYLVSLKIGTALISTISSEVSLPRSSVVETVKSLHKKGFMRYYNHSGRKVWFAENPESLMELLEERRRTFSEVMPSLKKLRSSSGGLPVLRVLEGEEEIIRIFEEVLGSKGVILLVVDWQLLAVRLGAEYISEFEIRRISRKIKMVLITPESEVVNDFSKNDLDSFRVTKILPQSVQIGGAGSFMFGNMVMVLSLEGLHPIGFEIKSAEIFNLHRLYFESLLGFCQ